MARRYPWVLAAVPWSKDLEFTRGRWCGKPLLSHNTAPRHLLATRRQLRAENMRPGGQDPVAFLYFRCTKAAKTVYANLYLIAEAKPVRPMTPARAAALAKAMAARRTCRECGETGWAELPRAHRTCEACLYTAGLAPNSYLHDYLIGEPTLTAAEHAALCGSEQTRCPTTTPPR
ncbi:RRQRL motif-containing zinc-binding protein [Amycolatopsis mediterranei]|uniref:RRQRL motif-containing zinc-binding protein n=1 Tax=Amycolatopsis mediterranei TaxID=33910 RepID=UPI003422EFD9